MTIALVLGANGQDGSYLSEILCARGYTVVAVGRQHRARWPVASERYSYKSCDIANIDILSALLRETVPDLVFHFAAIHGPAGFNYEAVWQQAHQVNTLSVHAVLEYIRGTDRACGLVYASSAKVFGSPLPLHIDEATPHLSTDIYSATKNAAHDLINYYRVRHGAKVSALYLFNHESPRRTSDFFIPRVVAALAQAKAGGGKSELYTLDFACDWGCAREYMEIVAEIAERGLGEDYVLATGKTWTGHEIVTALFARYKLDQAAYISQTAPLAGASALYHASNARLQKRLGRVPSRSILDVCDDFLRGAS